MSVYMHRLPHAFPNLVQTTPEHVRELVQYLLYENRIDAPDGSSFAVTVENPSRWRLWLSDTSYAYLENMRVLDGVERWEVTPGD